MLIKTEHWQRSFYTLWAGQAVSLITSAVLQMAIIWHLTEETGSAMVLSIATLVGFLPQAILGPFIGVLVDRYHRKYVMIGADLLIAAVGLVLALASLAMELPVWLIMVVLFLRSVGTAFHSPALNAVTPLLVPEDQLTKCAGYTQSIQSASYILGPALAALLYAVWDLNSIILVDVGGAVLASILTAFVFIPRLEAGESAAQGNLMLEMKEGYSALRSNKGLFALLWVGALYMLFFMPINALFPLMSMKYFGGTTFHASLVEIVFAAGMLAGGLVLGVWGGFKNRVMSLAASILLMGASLMVSGLLPAKGYVVFVLCSTLMGFSAPFYSAVQTALFQEKISPEYLGRVFALLGSVVSVAMPLGLVLSALFADTIGVNRWFLISGILITGIAVLPVLIPGLRNLDRQEDKTA
ncbi:MFS transporter [Desulfitobacterium chlororespirans]|uniref:MFS transporter, DHA3 family, macrolide efflux protein n=1 Tax=Desulfitobacterium chlororespirans DSM 11544 TaxID=1121395 RepID=A0A1M7UJI4_9FIRM|nr:MFS transporter [Desulfitobacterium chlororespirans]SHN83108.1 MFS transporter, DHA3 family, macrolide efflux protein [Desulfitobacterium chlororespirans DSM 11544]